MSTDKDVLTKKIAMLELTLQNVQIQKDKANILAQNL